MIKKIDVEIRMQCRKEYTNAEDNGSLLWSTENYALGTN